jgi:hypothetical protein
MNVTERDFLAQKEYYRDQMRAAQRYQQSKRVPSSGLPSYARALSWLGRRLADWGETLQERYGALVSPTLPQPR